jgi:hypothetical protein
MANIVPIADPPKESVPPSPEDTTAHRIRAGAALVARFIWRWDVVATVALAIFAAGGISAFYADDFAAARWLFAVAIVLLAVKTLSWNEVTNHKDRLWASLFVVALTLGSLYGSMKLIQGREDSQKQPEAKIQLSTTSQPPATFDTDSAAPPDKAQGEIPHKTKTPTAVTPHSNQARTEAPMSAQVPAAPAPTLPPVVCTDSANCGVSTGQTGGITAGTVKIDTPPLKITWKAEMSAFPPSVVTSKAAICGHFKTGHMDWPET